jgi:hypothetical protein
MATFLLGVAVGVVINLVTALFSRKHALQLIPWLCLYIVGHGAVLFLNSEPIRIMAMATARKYPPWETYPILVIAASILVCIYWWGINLGVRRLDTLTAPASPASTTLSSNYSEKITAPKKRESEPPKVEPLPHQSSPEKLTEDKPKTEMPQPHQPTAAEIAAELAKNMPRPQPEKSEVSDPCAQPLRIDESDPDTYKKLNDCQIAIVALDVAASMDKQVRDYRDARTEHAQRGGIGMDTLNRRFVDNLQRSCLSQFFTLYADISQRLGGPKDLNKDGTRDGLRYLDGQYPNTFIVEENASNLREMAERLKARTSRK